MRTIGFCISVLLFLPLPVTIQLSTVAKSVSKTDFKFHFSQPLFTKKKSEVSDTASLKQSSWYAEAIKNIRESEYEIKYDELTHSYASPNRKQNLKAFYTGDNFTLLPRNDSADKWKLSLQLKGIFSDKQKLYSTSNNPVVTQNGNNIQFNHNNEFITEYINSKEGVRQNFIISKKPAGDLQKIKVELEANKDWFINKVAEKEIHFAKATKNGYDKKITYNSLKAWDANGKELEAAFAVNKNKVSIDVNTNNSVYPVTIDPLSTGTAGTPDWVGDDADQAGALFGVSVASAGDINSDGYSDVIIGAFQYDDGVNTNEGRAFLYHGSATGLSLTPNSIPDDANLPGSFFGRSVASAGDINGDGYSDVIIGADGYDDGGNTDEGHAFVYYGSASGLSPVPNAILDDADLANAFFGRSVASAGDINGDGYSDVIIGAYGYTDSGNSFEGRAFVYHGSAAGLSATPNSTPDDADQAGAQFGICVASAGDVNGDGYSDVIIGAWFYNDGANSDEGRAFVYHGSALGLSAAPISTPDDADKAMAYFGWAVASAGDVNGDGYSDVIIGAYGYDDGVNSQEGRVYVYHGSSSGIPLNPNITLADVDQAVALFGVSVASAGDANGDGYSDVIIGASYYNDGVNTDEGQAFVHYGSPSGLSPTSNSIPDDADQTGAFFGVSVASAGDINGDGYSDVIIGAYQYDDGINTDEGRAFVYHGSPDGLSASPVNTPDDADQAVAVFGHSVASAGDINGDGYSDVIIGAIWYDDGANTNEGRAFVYHGSAAGLSATPNSTPDDADQAGAEFGFSVASAGDVNGDGYSDVIIGTYGYDDGANTDEGRAFVYHGSATGLSPTPISILDDADQATAYFGNSVASAGDVNGDGYSDVIIGAHLYSDGANTYEGRAFVYYGSASGLSATPNSTPDDADQNGASFGISVAAAGDVNGDGYSDVIIGAWQYDDGPNTDEGRAFVYYGSATGLSPTPNSILDDADQAVAVFGHSVASAGDINGDGYSDVIIGTYGYDEGANTDEGRAFVYHGSATGLSATPNSTPDDADQSGALFGLSVASAGDVNGDGYSDVIIGANAYDGANGNEDGQAFVYYGSATGLSATPNSILNDANQAGAEFGRSVASAGDINGDGYSDVIVGANFFNDGVNTDEGRAFVYYGNNNGGLRNNLRLYNTDLVTPMNRSNIGDPNLFGAGLYAKSFIGRQKGKLVWETIRNANPFSGVPITNSTAFTAQQPALTNLGLTGTELKNQIGKMVPTKATYIRTRVKYDLTTAITGQVYGPWRYPEGFLRGKREIGDVALPVKFIAFTVTKENETALLRWITTNEEPGMQYEVQHSADGIIFTAVTALPAQLLFRNEYEYRHIKPVAGNNFYRIKASKQTRESFTAVRQLYFNPEENKLLLYPNPVTKNQSFSVQLQPGFPDNININIISYTGQSVFKQTYNGTGKIEIQAKNWPAGNYVVEIWASASLISSSKLAVLND